MSGQVSVITSNLLLLGLHTGERCILWYL